jgi:CDP-diacylglycerol--serine O-phosphatidyltransferase
MALGFALISFYPPGVLFALFLVYAASGYVLALTRWNASRRNARKTIAGAD